MCSLTPEQTQSLSTCITPTNLDYVSPLHHSPSRLRHLMITCSIGPARAPNPCTSLTSIMRMSYFMSFTQIRRHSPRKDWVTGKMLGWFCTNCLFSCLCSATPILNQTINPIEIYPDLFTVPKEYLDLKEVFNEARATAFPPYRPYDCQIDLLPGTASPRGQL